MGRISAGVERMQRNLEPMRSQVETWRAQQLTSAIAKLIINIEDELDASNHLTRRVHELCFAPQQEDFQPRTMWSLSNAITSAFQELDWALFGARVGVPIIDLRASVNAA